MTDIKNLFKLFCFSAALTGCISKQPAYNRTIDIEKQKDGSCVTNVNVTCVGCKTEFTELGKTWNTASYGALGVPYGFVKGAYQGYQDSEHESKILKIYDSSCSAFKGIGTGCYQGLCYGYNLEYNKGRSVEGHVFDFIEATTDFLYDTMRNIR